MNLLVSSLFWFIGLIVSSFTLVSIITIFRFGIPFTSDLERERHLISPNNIKRRYLVSVLLLTLIYTMIATILFNATDSGFKGFIVGSIFSIIFGISKTGKNNENIRDYIEVNKLYFIKDKLM